MPIEVEDIEKGEDTQGNAQNNGQIVQDSPGNDQDTPEKVEATAPKKKGRPPGAKNKTKPPPPPVQTKKRSKVVVEPESESESEEAPTPPPSPATQRRSQWAAYRQKQVDAHQARQNHYTQALDKMLGF